MEEELNVTCKTLEKLLVFFGIDSGTVLKAAENALR